MKKIGIFLGTFDPIHYGHLAIALEAINHGMDKVVIYPSYDAPHKDITASNQARLDMCRLALKSYDNIELSSLLVDQSLGGYSMSVLEAIMKENPNDKLYYILGSDIYKYILTWPTIRQITSYFDFLVMLRDPGDFNTCKAISSKLSNKTIMMKGKINQISSSQIKECFVMNQDTSELLPSEVYHYISKYSTYKKN